MQIACRIHACTREHVEKEKETNQSEKTCESPRRCSLGLGASFFPSFYDNVIANWSVGVTYALSENRGYDKNVRKPWKQSLCKKREGWNISDWELGKPDVIIV